jgi:phage terminase large subunit
MQESSSQVVKVNVPPKLMPLVDASGKRFRYYVAYGGRGSAKSWTFARALLMQAMKDPLRVLCVREIQRTIGDSVHQLLVDQIKALGLEWFYTAQESTITGLNGCQFLYAGLRGIDAAKVKSFEGIDVVWAEEAQAIVKKSWDVLIPTIRADGSEVWVTFNPELDTDDTYQRFVVHPPEDAWVVKVNWQDNPWFPAVLEKERQHLQKTDPEAHDHVWGGSPRTVVEGAIYAKEVTAMIEQRRVTRVPHDPKLPVHTIWDLGWNDQTSIIFAQKVVSEVRIIDYVEESFLRLDEWAKKLRDKDYLYGDHYLPHDGGNSLQAAGGLSAQKILKPLLRVNPKVIPRVPSVEVPIKAARMMFPRVYMDEAKCQRLLDCLKRFRRGVPESTGEPGAPVKDEYRHGADAFGQLALVVDKITNDGRPQITMPVWEESVPGMGM